MIYNPVSGAFQSDAHAGALYIHTDHVESTYGEA